MSCLTTTPLVYKTRCIDTESKGVMENGALSLLPFFNTVYAMAFMGHAAFRYIVGRWTNLRYCNVDTHSHDMNVYVSIETLIYYLPRLHIQLSTWVQLHVPNLPHFITENIQGLITGHSFGSKGFIADKIKACTACSAISTCKVDLPCHNSANKY